MAYSVYVRNPTWVDGSGGGTSIDAADLNANDTGVFNAFYQPAVRVFHNANQAITTATDTALAFNSERYDQAGNAADTMHDTVTNNSRLTAKYAGVYKVTACVQFAANATGARDVKLRINGTTVVGWQRSATTSGTNDVILTATADYAFAVNDYVECVVRQDSGGNLNAISTANYSPEFSMVRVG